METAKMTNDAALEWLVEWGTVHIHYDYAKFVPRSRHCRVVLTNGYGPDMLALLYRQVKATGEVG